MGKVVAIANQKGGVGKTTTAINLAASIGVLEKKVLLIDADPQANATSGSGINEEEIAFPLYDCMINDVEASKAILNTETPNLDILCSDTNLAGAEIELVSQLRREYFVKKVVEQVRDDYDFIFIDCLPSLGLLAINSLVAADSVMIPIQCETYAVEGLKKLYDTILRVKSINRGLTIEGIVLSMFDARLKMANAVVENVRNNSKIHVFDTIIHRNSKIGEAPSRHQPVIMYDAGSRGAYNFLSLSREFMERNGYTFDSGFDKKSSRDMIKNAIS